MPYALKGPKASSLSGIALMRSSFVRRGQALFFTDAGLGTSTVVHFPRRLVSNVLKLLSINLIPKVFASAFDSHAPQSMELASYSTAYGDCGEAFTL